MSDKIQACISCIESKCEELAKLTDPKNKVEREYSMLAQRMINNFESLRKKQEDRDNKKKEKEESQYKKIELQNQQNYAKQVAFHPKSILKRRGLRRL